MRRFVQPPDDAVARNESEPIVVHGASENRSDQLVLFVHGLHGDRYETWGQFPHLLYHHTRCDVGLYGYASGYQRATQLSATFDKQSEELAHQLRDCDYRQITLIGHSMGGLMCMGAIRNLIDAGSKLAIRRISSLVLVGVPQAGSVRVPFWATWISSDLRLMRAHSRTLDEIQRRFIDHVVVSPIEQSFGTRFVIPTFAIVGTKDRWVTDLSATLRIPSDQVRRIVGTHTAISKPADADSEAFKFTRSRIQDATNFHEKRTRAQTKVQQQLSNLIAENFTGSDQVIASGIIRFGQP